MNEEMSQPTSPDPRIMSLRVRIKRMASFDERQNALKELLSIGHSAESLVPEITEKIGEWAYSDLLPKLIANLKCERLLKAAQNAGIRFQPYQQADLLEAGFPKFEQSLVDHLWGMKDSDNFVIYEDIFNALGKCARLPETLDTLVVLEEKLALRLKFIRAKREEEERRIDLGEMSLDDVGSSWVGGIGLAHFHGCLKKTVKKLRDRPLIGEVVTNDPSIEPESSHPPAGILELISLGESGTLEFKSTLRWDIKEGVINKKLEEVIMKTVAAFANSKGGNLLIGVADDGGILGLEPDCLSLGGVGRDKFELHLRNLLNQRFGAGFVASKISISFHEIDKKEVCQIETAPAKEPVILKVKDKNDQPTEKFYARSGNSSQEIPLSDMNAYIKERFHS